MKLSYLLFSIVIFGSCLHQSRNCDANISPPNTSIPDSILAYSFGGENETVYDIQLNSWEQFRYHPFMPKTLLEWNIRLDKNNNIIINDSIDISFNAETLRGVRNLKFTFELVSLEDEAIIRKETKDIS